MMNIGRRAAPVCFQMMTLELLCLVIQQNMLRALKSSQRLCAQITIHTFLQRMNIIWQRLMNMASFSQRSGGCCNLHCSISCTDLPFITWEGRCGMNLLLLLSVCFSPPLSHCFFFPEEISLLQKIKLFQMSFSVSGKT